MESIAWWAGSSGRNDEALELLGLAVALRRSLGRNAGAASKTSGTTPPSPAAASPHRLRATIYLPTPCTSRAGSSATLITSALWRELKLRPRDAPATGHRRHGTQTGAANQTAARPLGIVDSSGTARKLATARVLRSSTGSGRRPGSRTPPRAVRSSASPWYRSVGVAGIRPSVGGAQRPGRCTRPHGHSAASQAATASASGTSSSAWLARTHDWIVTSASADSEG